MAAGSQVEGAEDESRWALVSAPYRPPQPVRGSSSWWYLCPLLKTYITLRPLKKLLTSSRSFTVSEEWRSARSTTNLFWENQVFSFLSFSRKLQEYMEARSGPVNAANNCWGQNLNRALTCWSASHYLWLLRGVHLRAAAGH